METAIIIILGIYAAVMTYLRSTAAKTKSTVDDKVLEYGEKIEPVVELIKDRTEAKKKQVVA